MRPALRTYIYYGMIIVYLIGGLAAFTLSYINHWNKEHIGLVFVLGSAFVLLISRRLDKSIIMQETKKGKGNISRFFKVTFIIFIGLSLVSINICLKFKQYYYLPLQYFLVISLIGTLILLQIIIPKNTIKLERYLILLEILLLSGIVSYALIFLFPGPYGNDASHHIGFIESIIATGNIESYPGQYQNYPGYHFLFTFISLITGIKNMKLIQFFIAIIQAIFLIFVYMLTRKLFDTKISLISTLIVSLSPHLIQSRYMHYPCSFTAIFFIFVLYLLFYPNSKTVTGSSLLVAFFIITVFSHPLTPIILIFALLATFIITKYLKLEKVKILGTTILFMIILSLSWWMKPLGDQKDLFSYLVLSIKNALEFMDYTAVTRATLAPLYNCSDIVLSDFGFIILIFLGIAGAFYSLKNIALNTIKKLTSGKEKILTLSIVTLLFIPMPYLLTIIYPQSLPDRWFPFIEILASMFAGGAVVIISQLKRLSSFKLKYIAPLVVFILVFFMITSPVANPNNHIYAEELSSRAALTQSEIDAAEFIKSQRISLENIHGSTGFMALAFEKVFLERSINFIDPDNPNTYNSGYIIIRKYDFMKGFTVPLFGKKGLLMKIEPPNQVFTLYLNNANKLYINNETSIYKVENRRGKYENITT